MTACYRHALFGDETKRAGTVVLGAGVLQGTSRSVSTLQKNTGCALLGCLMFGTNERRTRQAFFSRDGVVLGRGAAPEVNSYTLRVREPSPNGRAMPRRS